MYNLKIKDEAFIVQIFKTKVEKSNHEILYYIKLSYINFSKKIQ